MRCQPHSRHTLDALMRAAGGDVVPIAAELQPGAAVPIHDAASLVLRRASIKATSVALTAASIGVACWVSTKVAPVPGCNSAFWAAIKISSAAIAH